MLQPIQSLLNQVLFNDKDTLVKPFILAMLSETTAICTYQCVSSCTHVRKQPGITRYLLI